MFIYSTKTRWNTPKPQGHLNYRLRVLLSGLINFLNMSAQNRQKCINPKRHNIILLLYCKIELK